MHGHHRVIGCAVFVHLQHYRQKYYKSQEYYFLYYFLTRALFYCKKSQTIISNFILLTCLTQWKICTCMELGNKIFKKKKEFDLLYQLLSAGQRGEKKKRKTLSKICCFPFSMIFDRRR